MTTAAVWESETWNDFAIEHPLWRMLLPSIQPALRVDWFKELEKQLTKLCADDTPPGRFLKEALRVQLSEGLPEHRTALYFLGLMMCPAIVDHARSVEDVDIVEWIDRDVAECLQEWERATHGSKISLFVALCTLRYRQAIATSVLNNNAAAIQQQQQR